MEVILKQDVQHLGSKDELVTVKPGYGRNFLIPKGFAIVANKANKKVLDETLKQRAFKESKLKEEAEAIAKTLENTTIKVGAKVGENDKIFGSVGTVQLADAMRKQGYTIERKNIKLENDNIKSLGTYKAEVKLHKEVSFELSFEVVGE